MGMLFDNVDDLVNILHAASLSLSSGDFTIGFWIKTTDKGVFFISKWTDTPSQRGWLIQIRPTTGVLAFQIDTSAVFNAAGVDIADGVWHFCLIILNGTALKFYVDNVEYHSATVSNPTATTIDLKLGTGGIAGGFWGGTLTEFFITDVALDAVEREIAYNSRLKGINSLIQPSNYPIYLPMDDGPDGSSADGDTLRDLSGNGNDGLGDDGPNNAGLIWEAEEVLSYPPAILPVIFVPIVIVPPTIDLFRLQIEAAAPNRQIKAEAPGRLVEAEFPNRQIEWTQ